MTKQIRIFTILIAVIFAFGMLMMAGIEKDDGKFIEKVEKTFSVSGEGTISLETVFGSVKVLLSDDKSVRVEIVKTADVSSETDAKELFALLDISFKQSGNDLLVKVKKNTKKIEYLNLQFALYLPKNYNADISTGGGSIKATNLFGSIKANTGGGSVKVGNIEGSVKVNTGGGSVAIGAVTKGMVNVNTGGGSIKIKDVEKDVKANTGGGSISIEAVGGTAVVNTGGGSIKIGPTKGTVHANTGGGSIKIEKTNGSIKANTGGGSILVDGSGGTVNINTGGGSLKIKEARGYLAGNTGGGSIYAKFMGFESSEKKGVKLSTGGGDITLYIPADLKATLDVTIELDDKDADEVTLKSDFNIKVKNDNDEIISTSDINGGGPKIILRTVDSNIEIKKL